MIAPAAKIVVIEWLLVAAVVVTAVVAMLIASGASLSN